MRVIRGLVCFMCPLGEMPIKACNVLDMWERIIFNAVTRDVALKHVREIGHRLEGGPNSSPRRFSSPSLLRKLNETESQRLNSRRKHIVNIVEIHSGNGLCLMCVESLLLSLSNNSSDHHDWLLHIILYFSHHVTWRGEYLDLLWTLCTFSLGFSSVSDMQTTQYALFLNTEEFLKENRSKSNSGIMAS